MSYTLVWCVFIFIHFKAFSNFLLFFPLQHLFRSLLFSVHVFVTFTHFLVSLISNFIPVWLENILCMILIRLYIYWTSFCGLTCGLCLNNVLCALKKKRYSVIVQWSVQYVCYIYLVHCVAQVLYSLIDFLSNCSVHYWKWGIEASNHYLWIIYFSLQLGQFVLHVFWNSIVREMYLYNCCIFVTDWTFIMVKYPYFSLIIICIWKVNFIIFI